MVDSRFEVLDAKKVHALRGQRSTANFVRFVGLAVDTVNKMLNGDPVRRSNADKLARACGTSYEALLLESDAGGIDEWLKLPAREKLIARLSPLPCNQSLERSEIDALMSRCGLYEPTPPNRHLAYNEGDLSFWSRQSAEVRRGHRMLIELVARRVVLDAAASADVVLSAQGDLSHAATGVMPFLWKVLDDLNR